MRFELYRQQVEHILAHQFYLSPSVHELTAIRCAFYFSTSAERCAEGVAKDRIAGRLQ